MITEISGLPDRVAGFVCSGSVTAREVENVVIPAIESRIMAYGSVRVLCQVGPEWTELSPGVLWDDLKLGLSHRRDWDRIAVVTDLEWIHRATDLWGLLLLLDVTRTFPNREFEAARQWILS